MDNDSETREDTTADEQYRRASEDLGGGREMVAHQEKEGES